MMPMEMEDVDMWIYNSNKVKFLFKSWSTFELNSNMPMPMGEADNAVMGDYNVNKWAYFGCLCATLTIGILVEYISTVAPKGHIPATAVYFFKLLTSYTLMLIVMTFNLGLLISAVFGLTIGYYCFGFSPAIFRVQGQKQGNLLANEWEASPMS
jgi:hypothetical protein